MEEDARQTLEEDGVVLLKLLNKVKVNCRGKLKKVINKGACMVYLLSRFITATSILSLFAFAGYDVLLRYGKSGFGILIPFLIWFICSKTKRVLQHRISDKMSLYSSLLLVFVFLFLEGSLQLSELYVEYKFTLVSILIIAFFVTSIVNHHFMVVSTPEKKESDSVSQYLFNLLYINVSKTHEIAMLIDNKIMKTVEQEQISESLLKSNYSLGFANNAVTANGAIQHEDNSKQRVYENFDVKTTKSIMLKNYIPA